MTGGADLFIGFGGVVERAPVAAEADWYVYKYSQLVETLKRYKVSIECVWSPCSWCISFLLAIGVAQGLISSLLLRPSHRCTPSRDNLAQYGVDPESVDDNGLQFPQNRVINVGINLSL